MPAPAPAPAPVSAAVTVTAATIPLLTPYTSLLTSDTPLLPIHHQMLHLRGALWANLLVDLLFDLSQAIAT